MTRDSQRQRLYDAEKAAFPPRTGHRDGRPDPDAVDVRRFETVSEVQEFVTRIETSAWYRRWFPNGVRRTQVTESTRAHRFARGGWGNITLPAYGGNRWGHVDYVVLHELAHNLLEKQRYTPCSPPCTHDRMILFDPVTGEPSHSAAPLAPHGPEFTRVLVDLVERWMGVDHAVRLRRELRARHVRIATRRQAFQ